MTMIGPRTTIGTGGGGSFFQTWAPYARAAAAKLHIPWQDILGQWGMETAWGTQRNMGRYNVGNVGNLGAAGWQNYASPSAFTQAYISAMRQDFPYFQHPVAHPTLGQIFNGPNRYDPGTTTYATNVAGGVQTVDAQRGLPTTTAQLLGGSQSAPNGSYAPPSGPAISNMITSLHTLETTNFSIFSPIQSIQAIVVKAGLFLLIILFLVAGFYLLFGGSATMPGLGSLAKAAG